MKLNIACAAALLACPLVSAHGPGHRHNNIAAIHRRQATSSTSVSQTRPAPTNPSTSRTVSSAPPTASAPAPPVSHATTTVTTTTTPGHPPATVTGGGVTAPGAVPLSSILPASVQSAGPTSALPATGAKPSGLPNAPALPNLSSWNPAKYPASDKPPPTNSPQVIEWINQVRNSGVVIPDIKPFTYGENMCALPQNSGRVGNDTECWWTCGHCNRKTDITSCTQKGTWGSSFDDGPAPYTPNLLTYLEAQKLKTTFFVVGSRVKDRPQYLQTEFKLGHTIGVHTWSHTALSTQTTEAIIAEFGWTKQIIKDALGVTPLYMRPPYGDIDDRVRAIAFAMNLTPVSWTVADGVSFDTFDWEVPSGDEPAAAAVNQFQTILQHASNLNTGYIVLEHDLWEQEVELATGYFMPSALAAHTTITSINQCNGQSLASVYAETVAAGASLPAGSGEGGFMTGWGQKAPANAPLGGSDGSNTDPNVPAGSGDDDDEEGEDGARSLLQTGEVMRLVGAVALAALISSVGAL